MRVCIDLDGTLCDTKAAGQNYLDVRPKEGAVEAISNMRARGDYIIIHTARNMETENNNLGRIIAIQGPVIEKWCSKHGISYDELWFGKPLADCYIDDKAIRYDNNWSEVNEILSRHS